MVFGALLATLLCTNAGEVSTTAPGAAAASHRWHASVQAGAGMLAEDPAAVLFPRLGYVGDLGVVTLSLPVYARLADLPAARLPPPADGGPAWAQRWEDPEAWLSVVEDLQVSFGDGVFAAEVASLAQQSAGRAALVDTYQGTVDPLRRRTGAHVELHLDTLDVLALTDSFVDPRLVAAAVEVAPLAWLDLDDERAWRLSLTGAVDPSAPHLSGGRNIAAPVSGAELGVSWAWLRREHVAIATYLTGNVLAGLQPATGGDFAGTDAAAGAHLGMRMEVATRSDPSSDALVVDVQGVAAGEGYTPGYFDLAYGVERSMVAARAGRPKASLRPRAGWGVRGRVDVRLGPLRVGVCGDTNLRGEVSACAYGRLVLDRVTASATLVERRLTDADQVVDAQHTSAQGEVAVRLWDGLFAFTHARYGWRDAPGVVSREPVFDWMAGAGWALAGEL